MQWLTGILVPCDKLRSFVRTEQLFPPFLASKVPSIYARSRPGKRPTHVLPRLLDKTSAPPNPLSAYLFIFPPYPKVVVDPASSSQPQITQNVRTTSTYQPEG